MKRAMLVTDNTTGSGLFISHEILSIPDIAIQKTGEPEGTGFEIAMPDEAYHVQQGYGRVHGQGRAENPRRVVLDLLLII
jgi:hypothetical protein